MGYTGSAQGLLDANTNLTYAVKYLAGAWRVAGGSHDRAVGYYASGYYYAAKRRGMAGVTTAQPAQVAQLDLPNPLAAFAQDTSPRRLTRAERRTQMRGVPSSPTTSTQAP
jgi:soluble lytic murein transglycosylase-like protein